MSDCIFCKIINKEIPSNIVDENKNAIAFLDIAPMSYGHILVIPKKHFSNLSLCDNESLSDVFLLAKQVAKKLQDLNIGINGFNYLSNENEIAGQVVPHFHVHIIPKYTKEDGLLFSSNELIENNELKEKILSLVK